MVDVAFFGVPVPLAGVRKPFNPNLRARFPVALGIAYRTERLLDGRYLVTGWMTNRCGNLEELGRSSVCVMNDFGFLVVVEDRGHPWH
jgi:hypothetical protein